MSYASQYRPMRRNLVDVPAIPRRDMRPDVVNGLTADAQWDYKADSAVPQVPLPRGFPRGWPACDANALRDYFAAEREARRAPSKAPRRSLRDRVAQLEAFIRDAGMTVPEAVAA